jgi:hypothetical protein
MTRMQIAVPSRGLFRHPADPTSLQLYSSQLQSGTYTPDSLELTLTGSDEFFKLNRKN